jgi:hypothetical protein
MCATGPKSESVRLIEMLQKELSHAYQKNVIPYYHIGRVSGDSGLEYIDVYVGIHKQNLHQEDVLKSYIRHKYGGVVRAISVELAEF